MKQNSLWLISNFPLTDSRSVIGKGRDEPGNSCYTRKEKQTKKKKEKKRWMYIKILKVSEQIIYQAIQEFQWNTDGPMF